MLSLGLLKAIFSWYLKIVAKQGVGAVNSWSIRGILVWNVCSGVLVPRVGVEPRSAGEFVSCPTEGQ